MSEPDKLDIIAIQQSLLSMRPKERLDALISRPDAMPVVRALPAQDVLILIKDIGITDCLEFLELLSPQQVQEILDLDAWQGPSIYPTAIGPWLAALHMANPRRAAQTFCALDIALSGFLFKQYTRIYETADLDNVNDDSSIRSDTPDRHYTIFFDDSAPEQDLVLFLKQTIEQLYQRDYKFVLRLIETARFETASMLEEEALRWRDGRMQDMGFPSFDEASSILAYISPNLPLPQGGRGTKGEGDSSPLPVPFTIPPDWRNFVVLNRALQNASDDAKQRFVSEFVNTANCLQLALKQNLGDSDSLRETVRRVASTIEKALMHLSKGDDSMLSGLLHLSARKLFQIGNSLRRPE